MDATLGEIADLVREVHEAARATGTVFDVALISPDPRSSSYRLSNLGTAADF